MSPPTVVWESKHLWEILGGQDSADAEMLEGGLTTSSKQALHWQPGTHL
jgi:hypothetical protein